MDAVPAGAVTSPMTTFRSTEITAREYIGAAFHRAAADISMLNQ